MSRAKNEAVITEQLGDAESPQCFHPHVTRRLILTTAQAGVEVSFQIHTQEVFTSISAAIPVVLISFPWFSQSFKTDTEIVAPVGTTEPFLILTNSSFIEHPAVPQRSKVSLSYNYSYAHAGRSTELNAHCGDSS